MLNSQISSFLRQPKLLPVTLAMLFVLLALALFHPILDGDVFFYLSLGREILRTGNIPAEDPFLFSITQWNVTHEWLAYLAYFGAHFFFGFLGIYFLSALPWFFIFGYLVWLGLREKISGTLLCMLLLLAGAVSSQRFIDRASLVSDALIIALTCYFLFKDKIERPMTWILPLIFLFWVNWHPGFLAGLILFAGFVVIKRTSLGIFCATLFACLINPTGWRGALYPILSTASPDWGIFRRINYEWMPSFHQPMLGTQEVQIFLVLAFLTLSLMIRTALRSSTKMWMAWYVAAVLGYLVQDAVRFLPTAALGCVALCLYCCKLAPLPTMKRFEVVGQGLILCASLLGCFWISGNGYSATSGHRDLRLGLEESSFPTGALEFIQTKKIEGRFFNQYEWGSFLIWNLDKKGSLFIHTHVDDPHFLLDEYYGISGSESKFNQTINKDRIDYFLLDSKIFNLQPRPGILLFLQGWKILYQDSVSTLWGRADRN